MGQRSRTDLPRGTEMILLVEEETVVRSLAFAVLTDCGYTVCQTGLAADAVQIAEREREALQLLLADIAMRGQGGRSLAERISRLSPSIKVLFTSGYPDELVRAGPGGRELNFLSKPFTPRALAEAVRNVLDSSAKECLS